MCGRGVGKLLQVDRDRRLVKGVAVVDVQLPLPHAGIFCDGDQCRDARLRKWMPQSCGQRRLFQDVCGRSNLERLEADLRVVAATQVGGRWQNADMAGVGGQDSEKVAVRGDGELGDVPWRR